MSSYRFQSGLAQMCLLYKIMSQHVRKESLICHSDPFSLLLRVALITNEPQLNVSSVSQKKMLKARKPASPTYASSLRIVNSLSWPPEFSTCWARKGQRPTILQNIFVSFTTESSWNMKKSGQVCALEKKHAVRILETQVGYWCTVFHHHHF